jgi:hypothetical protein
MKFKSWKDYYIFIRDYAKYSCLNCSYCGNHVDTDEYNSDVAYTHHFCAYYMAMKRWDIDTFVCPQWKSVDGEPADLEDVLFTIDEHTMRKFEKNRLWTIDEIREVLEK